MLWFFSGHFEEFATNAGEVAEMTAFSLGPDVTHPRSEGTVTLHSTPRPIRPGSTRVTSPIPRATTSEQVLEGIKLARRIAEQPALADWIERELQPGPEMTSDDELMAYARDDRVHRLPPGRNVQDGRRRTIRAPWSIRSFASAGIRRLRVADASIIPSMIGVNINITCMMIGEKCADLVKAG